MLQLIFLCLIKIFNSIRKFQSCLYFYFTVYWRNFRWCMQHPSKSFDDYISGGSTRTDKNMQLLLGWVHTEKYTCNQIIERLLNNDKLELSYKRLTRYWTRSSGNARHKKLLRDNVPSWQGNISNQFQPYANRETEKSMPCHQHVWVVGLRYTPQATLSSLHMIRPAIIVRKLATILKVCHGRLIWFFTNICQCLESHNQLYLIKPTRLCTKASRQGLGFLLQQKTAEGTWTPIQAGFCFLTDTESCYTAIKLEMLAVCRAISKCKLFLTGLQHYHHYRS